MSVRPTIRQLQYILALYETGNFRKAADMCCVGQSAISIALRELEDQLGVMLFERTNRRVQPSAECEQVIDAARQILADVDAMVTKVKGAESVFAQPQRLGVIHTIAPYFLPKALPLMHDRWPEMQLFLHEGQTAELLDKLDRNKLDLLLMAFPYPLEGQFSSALVGSDPFWLAMPANHALVERSSIRAEDIPAKNLLLLEDGHCLREHAKDACMLDNIKANSAFNGTSLNTLMHMVILGMGVTLLPHMAVASPLVSHPSVVFRPLHPDLPARQVGIVWRHTSAHKDEYQLIAQLLREAFVAASVSDTYRLQTIGKKRAGGKSASRKKAGVA